MAILETLKGWRTVAFNVACMLAAIAVETLAYMGGDSSWTAVLGPYGGVALLAVNVVNIVLRAVTNTKIGCNGCSR